MANVTKDSVWVKINVMKSWALHKKLLIVRCTENVVFQTLVRDCQDGSAGQGACLSSASRSHGHRKN